MAQDKFPLQPIVREKGAIRFKGNPIVRFLLDHSTFDLDDLAKLPFTDEEREHFAQLIGYDGFAFTELPYVSEQTIAAMDVIVRKMEPDNPRPFNAGDPLEFKVRGERTEVHIAEMGDFRGSIQDESFGKAELYQLQIHELRPTDPDDDPGAERREMDESGEWFQGFVNDLSAAKDIVAGTIKAMNKSFIEKPREPR